MKYTLAFDVYGTLIDTSGVFNSLQEMIGGKAQALMDTWRNKQLEYSFRRGLMKDHVDFSVCTREALEFCCKAYQIDLSHEQKTRLMDEYTVLPAFDDVESSLNNLKTSGNRLFAFSNGSKKAVSQLLNHANLIDCFEGIVSTEDVKTFKPNPDVYEYFNKATHSTKSDSWLISSNPFDVIGAKSYGMRSVWVQRSTDSVFDPWGTEPTLIIRNLDELASGLGRIH